MKVLRKSVSIALLIIVCAAFYFYLADLVLSNRRDEVVAECLNPRFIVEPKDLTAVVGSKVTLPCQAECNHDDMEWIVDGFRIGTNSEASKRYSVAGDDRIGIFSLQIFPIILEDEGYYQVQIGSNHSSRILSREARLTVLAPPSDPEILNGVVATIVFNMTTKLVCISRAKPPAELIWTDEIGKVITDHVKSFRRRIGNSSLVETRLSLMVSGSKDLHNKTITCTAWNEALDHLQIMTVKPSRVKILVDGPPEVDLLVERFVIQGTKQVNMRFICNAKAFSGIFFFEWFINGIEIQQKIASNELKVYRLSTEDNGSVIKCEVSNHIGSNSTSVVIQIS